MKQHQILPLITFLVIYAFFLMAPAIGLLLLPIAPYMFLMYAGGGRLNAKTFLPLIIFMGAGAVASPGNAIIYVMYAVAAPLILLVMYRREEGFSYKGILYAALPSSVLYAAVLFFSPEIATGMQTDIAEAIGRYYEATILTDARHLQGQEYLLYENRDKYAALFVRLSPSLILSLLIFISYFTGKIYFRPPHDKIIEIPDFMLLFPVCGGICLLLQKEELFVPGAGILLICGMLYFCRGFDIIWYYMNRWKLFIFFKIAAVMCIMLSPPIQAAIAVLGLVSVFANLIIRHRPEEESGKS